MVKEVGSQSRFEFALGWMCGWASIEKWRLDVAILCKGWDDDRGWNGIRIHFRKIN